jgi:predicted hydrocarbon binding protein
MHGVVFAELQKYVQSKLGNDAWPALLRRAGLANKVYMPITEYPDAEALALVSTASEITGKPAGAILEDFGEFIAPDLLALYRGLVRPEWKTLDLLEHTEETIHKVVRIKNAGARPPQLRVRRTSPSQVVITYASQRKMCALAVGIARGVAKHYQEQIAVSQSRCMLKGHPECHIEVATVAGRAASAK